MRDRLIELIEKAVVESEFMYPADVDPDCIADTILADGWIRPPCKVGDTVWWADTEFKEFLKGEIVSFSLQKEGLYAYCRYKGGFTYWHLVSDYFGKTVFLAREEAEAKLKERENNA